MIDDLIDLGLDRGPRWLRKTWPLGFPFVVVVVFAVPPLRDPLIQWLVHFEMGKATDLMHQFMPKLPTPSPTPGLHP